MQSEMFKTSCSFNIWSWSFAGVHSGTSSLELSGASAHIFWTRASGSSFGLIRARLALRGGEEGGDCQSRPDLDRVGGGTGFSFKKGSEEDLVGLDENWFRRGRTIVVIRKNKIESVVGVLS